MKRLTALVMAILMMVSILPADALAAGRNNGHGKGNDQVVDTSESVHLPALQEETVEELSSRTGLGRIKVHSGKNALPKRASVRFSSASADEERIFDFLRGNNGLHKGQLKKAAKAPAKGANSAAEPETEYRVLAMYDISVEKSDQSEWQPDGETVRVEVELETPVPVNEGASLTLVHIDDDGNMSNAGGSFTIEDGMLKGFSFNAAGFSVYAVVEKGNTGDYARMNLHFMNGTTEVAVMIVKNGDTLEELETIIYDPGVGTIPEGTIFKGWFTTASYIVADAENGMNIEDVRDWAAERTITENEDVYLYAMLYKNFVVNYLDENGVGVGSDNVFLLSTDTSSTYTVNMAYTPKDDTHAFLGWNVSEGSSNIQGYTAGTLYANGTDITISGSVTFSVNAPEGHWLVFDENGKGGTYNAPVFVKSNDVTAAPSGEMSRFGYTFGGWYDTKEHADAHGANPSVTTGQFQFDTTISDRTTVYASWIPAATANYTVIIWKEKSRDTYANNAAEGKTRNYDFWKAYNLTGNVGATITAVSNSTTSTSDVNGTYYDVRVQGTRQGGGNVNEVVSETGYHAARYDTGVTIVPEGTSIVNVYYDRHTVTYTFHYPYGQSRTFVGTANNGTISGVTGNQNSTYYSSESGNTRVYWRNNYFRTGNNNNSGRYTGDVYLASGQNSWQTYQAEIGLYGEKLNWPTDTSIWWYPNGNNGATSGTRMTYKNDFIPLTSDMSVDYYGVTGSGNQEIRFYTQDLTGGNNYTLQYSVSASNVGSFNVNDKFTGFQAYQTRSYTNNGYGGGSWSNWANVGALDPSTGIYGSAVDVNNILEIRYRRLSNTIAFMDGKYVDGNNNPIEEGNRGELHETAEMFCETDLTSYNKNGANYYTPTAPAGYVFEGWYADEACTQEYNFTTMPVTGVTVYAKWRQVQYRVFLHPNADNISDLDWGSESQAMNFRVSLGGSVSAPTGRSAEWEFVGWYTDPSLSAASLFAADMVLNESTVTAAYNKTTDLTDPMDKWGHLGSNPYNSDLTGNNGSDRFWITKKLDLYAKWRAKLVGAKGINVVYNAVEGTNAPTDNNQYLDQAQATAQAASTAPKGKQFVRWVVQKWNTETNKYEDTSVFVYPGDSFEVLKSDAKYVVTGYANPNNPEDISTSQDDTYTEIVATYTVQLRAEYVDVGTGSPTHIYWYPNYGANEMVQSNDPIQINEAVNICQALTREGYTFLGWSRVDVVAGQEGALHPELTSPNFLRYNSNGTWTELYSGSNKTVTQVAADERTPYHDLYAVWERDTGTLVVKKVTDPAGITTQNYSFTVKNAAGKFLQQDKTTYGDTAYNFTVAANNANGITFTDLPTEVYTVEEVGDTAVTGYRFDGTAYDYAISEGTVSSADVQKDKTTTVTITNKYTKLVDVTVTKTFSGIQETEVPTGFTINYTITEGQNTINGSLKTTDTNVTKNGLVYTWVIEGVPVGAKLDATETGYAVEGYKSEAANESLTIASVADSTTNKLEFTNTYTLGSLTVTKSFDGDSISEDQQKAVTFTVTGPNNYSETFTYAEMTGGSKTLTGLKLGAYTVAESNADVTGLYTRVTTANGATANSASVTLSDAAMNGTAAFVNTYTVEKTDITVTKVWNDASNQDGKRPTKDEFKASLILVTGGTDTETPTISGTGDNWTITYSDLPKAANGVAIEYSVTESTITGYDAPVYVNTGDNASVTGKALNGGTITNSYTPETVTVILTKTWVDTADKSFRPDADSFAKNTLILTGYTGQKMHEAVDNQDGTYTVTWTNLPKYQPGAVGTEIIYGVTEDATTIPLYTAGTVESDSATTDATANKIGFKVTNTRKTAKIFLGKQVTGNMGDRSKVFHFTVTVMGADGKTLITTIQDVTTDGANITRMHGDATLLGPDGTVFPVGATVTITETEGNGDGYTTTSQVDEADATAETTVTFTVSENGNTVIFENNREVKVDTGVSTESKPYLMLLALIPLAGAALVIGARRRRRAEV